MRFVVLSLTTLFVVGFPQEPKDVDEWAPSDVQKWLVRQGFSEHVAWFQGVSGRAFLMFKEKQLVSRLGTQAGSELFELIQELAKETGKQDDGLLVFPLTWEEGDGPEVTIVIAFFNHAAVTRACLEALHTHLPMSTGVQIVLVDDNSTEVEAVEDMLAMLSGEALVVIRNEQNLGFLRSANAGASIASGRYIVFLNNDADIQAGWLEALLSTMEHPRVGMACSKLVYPDGRLQEAGGIVMADGFGINYGRDQDPNLLQFNYFRDVDYGSGAAIMINASLWHRLGGFDDRYAPAYYEDTDLAFSVRASGHRVVYQPKAVVTHYERLTHGRTGAVEMLQQVNRNKFVKKWQAVLARDHCTLNCIPEVAKDFVGKDGMHVLVLDYATPRPDMDSGSLRMIHLLGAIRDTGAHVTFRARLFDFEGYIPLVLDMGVEYIRCENYDDLMLRGSNYDIVIISRRDDFSEMHPIVREDFPGAYIVYDTVDLHYIREEREAQLEHRVADTTLKQLELGLMGTADLTLVVSSFEFEHLVTNYPQNLYDILSNIHTETPSLVPLSPRQAHMRIMFTGNYHHHPNVDAMEWYVDNVHDLVRSKLPNYELIIVGTPLSNFEALSWLPERLQQMQSRNVFVRGFVADMAPLFDEVVMTIAPLRYGAGVKGKVSQSLAYGVPVVTSSIGAEGMGIKHGVHCLVGSIDDPRDFADQIVRLATDNFAWKRLRDNGLQIVKEKFSPRAAGLAVSRMISYARNKKKDTEAVKRKNAKKRMVFTPLKNLWRSKVKTAVIYGAMTIAAVVMCLLTYGLSHSRQRRSVQKLLRRMCRRLANVIGGKRDHKKS